MSMWVGTTATSPVPICHLVGGDLRPGWEVRDPSVWLLSFICASQTPQHHDMKMYQCMVIPGQTHICRHYVHTDSSLTAAVLPSRTGLPIEPYTVCFMTINHTNPWRQPYVKKCGFLGSYQAHSLRSFMIFACFHFILRCWSSFSSNLTWLNFSVMAWSPFIHCRMVNAVVSFVSGSQVCNRYGRFNKCLHPCPLTVCLKSSLWWPFFLCPFFQRENLLPTRRSDTWNRWSLVCHTAGCHSLQIPPAFSGMGILDVIIQHLLITCMVSFFRDT